MSYSQYFYFTDKTTQSDNVHTEHRGAAHLYSGTLRTVESTPAHLYGRNSPKENRLAIWLILRSLPWPLQLHRHSQKIYIFDHFNFNTPSWISSTSMPSTRYRKCNCDKHGGVPGWGSLPPHLNLDQSCQTCARLTSSGHN